MAFELKRQSARVAESPEAMFGDLRGRSVEGLLVHQADLLRDYMRTALDAPDVAIQSPTGSGKTLVGLLIAEWRRRSRGERVLFLCPTNQLVHQVAAQAHTQYGLTVTPFTGPKRDYEEHAKAEWLMGRTVGITSYAALFNTHPFFESPQVIVLDDAHSAENYIAGAWALHVDRRKAKHAPLFSALSGVLQPVLQRTEYTRLTADQSMDRWDESWVDSLPLPVFWGLIDDLTSVIDAHAASSGDLRFPWSWLKGHLDACHVYLGRGEILIRPLIPPSTTHAPFAGATQRIYMSATLGAGGDLERITGRDPITRLALPATWERHSVGRRLFFFPSSTLSAGELRSLAGDMIKRAGRAVVLTTDSRREADLGAMVQELTGFRVFNAREIEESKAEFVETANAVAVVANRFDGVDFPGDECRLLFVDKVPNATNLQERFFSTRIGAIALLNDRVMTRLVQGFGRCTRSATDFAAVVVFTESLFSYLAAAERRRLLHPELQAELEFGMDESVGKDSAALLENLDLFLSQDEQWRTADAAIVELRATKSQLPLPGADDLRAAVRHEVGFQYAMWGGRYDAALDHARSALGALNAPSLRGYRALWYYLAGNAAWLASQHGQGVSDEVAREYYALATNAVPNVRWLADLARVVGDSNVTPPDHDQSLLAVVERLEGVFEQLGSATNHKFDRAEQRVLEGLLHPDGKGFEQSHVELGRLLGYDAGKIETDASPDPWWRADDGVCIVFEDHAGAGSSGILDASKARQAATHDNWIRENVLGAKDSEIVKILITPVTRATSGAMPHIRVVHTWPIEAFRAWAKAALATLRVLKTSFREPGDLEWRAHALSLYGQNDLSPARLRERARRESEAVTWSEG